MFVCLCFFFFFFKQKTAYEIYQCDWSSDVCSSDLLDFNSLTGLNSRSFSTTFSAADVESTADTKGGYTSSTNINALGSTKLFGPITYTPQIQLDRKSVV